MVTPRDIYFKVPVPALYEQLAEECVELAHAALKIARAMRDENYTPVSIADGMTMVNEEFTDLKLVADVLGLTVDRAIMQDKMKRWNKRLGGDHDA